ncbi:MAG: hypothetical protein K6V36_10640 [Anaerolineae bacterium]|nr:hypothetical protein [Anaerolineae bacterium]
MSDDARRRHQIALVVILAVITVLSFLLAESLEPPRESLSVTGDEVRRPAESMVSGVACVPSPGGALVGDAPGGSARAVRRPT